MCTFLADEIELVLSGLVMVVTDEVMVELDPSDGRVSALYVGTRCLTSKPDAVSKALHAAMVETLEGPIWADTREETLREWFADEPSREADYRREARI